MFGDKTDEVNQREIEEWLELYKEKRNYLLSLNRNKQFNEQPRDSEKSEDSQSIEFNLDEVEDYLKQLEEQNNLTSIHPNFTPGLTKS